MLQRFLFVATMTFLLGASAVQAGYPGIKWNDGIKVLFKRFPDVARVNACYFEGVNLFDGDSIESFDENLLFGRVERRIFGFQKGTLVSVEHQLNMKDFNRKAFFDEIIKPLRKKYPNAQVIRLQSADKTKEQTAILFRDKDDTVLALYGRFKLGKGENLDWARVRYFKTRFFDYRNQRRFCGRWKGPARLLCR